MSFNIDDLNIRKEVTGSSTRFGVLISKEVEEYQTKYRPGAEIEIQPVKTVVISQEPKAGETVPQGTEVKVVMTSKGTLPVDIFVLDEAIATTYKEKDVGIVLRDLEEKGAATKAILEQDKEFDVLGSDEKKAVKEYAEQNLGFTGSDENLKNVYNDLKFLNNF